MSDMERAVLRVNAYLRFVELGCEAWDAHVAQLAAVRMTPEEREAHPESWHPKALDLGDWYRRLGETVADLRATDE